MADDLAQVTAFIEARLAEGEWAVKDSLCIHCGGHTVPLLSVFGITGYTHDGRMSNGRWEYGWQGVRCQGRLTGAEPVQKPARVLASVRARRAIVALAVDQAGYDLPAGGHEGRDPDERAADEAVRSALRDVLCRLAGEWDDHPDYEADWAAA